MKIVKFGGSSVSSAAKIKDVVSLIKKENKNIIVLSAFEGTTNTLIEITDHLYRKNSDEANKIIDCLKNKYSELISELYATQECKSLAEELLNKYFATIRSFTEDLFTMFEEKTI